MKGVDQARQYDKNINTRFVNNICEETKEMSKSAVSIVRSWRDGNFPQINALSAVHLKKKWIDEKNGYNKQSANRSGTEQ